MAHSSPTYQTAHKHWLRILRRWPIDLVRPDTVSFRTVMQKRLENISKPTSSTAAADNITSNEALVTAKGAPQTWNEAAEMKQVNALYSLLENRYAKTYPLPEHLRRPQSAPTYYDDLMRELEEAPHRSWIGGFVKRMKGMLRFS